MRVSIILLAELVRDIKPGHSIVGKDKVHYNFLHTTEESKGEAEYKGLWVLLSHLRTKTSGIFTQRLWKEGRIRVMSYSRFS